jgi:MFS family permease
MSLFRSLKHRAFLLLWLGQTISRVGDFMYEIALAWWVLEETHDAAIVGAVLVFAITPSILFYLIGGVAVDRFSRVRLMLASDAARGAVVLLISFLALTDQLEIWEIFAASLFFGFVDAFFQPAFTALVPQIVPEKDLPSANSLSSMSTNIGRVVGLAIGGGIVALLGSPLAFLINGISFFVSAAFLLPLLRLNLPRAVATVGTDSEKGNSVLHDLRAGFATVLKSQWLWVSILVFALTNITLAGPFSVAMPFLVEENLNASAETLGLLYAVFPLGYIIGGVFLGRYARIRRRGLLIYGTGIVGALMLGTFGLLPPVWVLVIAALINGATLEMGHLAWTTTLQELVPNEKLGRVVSIDNMGSFALLPVGYALAGWATEAFGAPIVFLVGGLFTASVYALGLLVPAIRNLD